MSKPSAPVRANRRADRAWRAALGVVLIFGFLGCVAPMRERFQATVFQDELTEFRVPKEATCPIGSMLKWRGAQCGCTWTFPRPHARLPP